MAEKLKDFRLGFLGAGQMAQAIATGLINSGTSRPEQLTMSDVYQPMLEKVKALGIETAPDNSAVVKSHNIVLLAVKPHIVAPVLKEIAPFITAQHLVISIAAAITLSSLQELLPQGTRVVRVMPNTPALVQCGATVISRGSHASDADRDLVQQLFATIGYSVELAESSMDAVTALSGGGPAFCFMMIEAMADGGVKCGLPRAVAQKLAAQTMMGAAKMVMETGTHPGELKDAVCSPGGTTIRGVHELERGGVRASLITAVEAAAQRSEELSQKHK